MAEADFASTFPYLCTICDQMGRSDCAKLHGFCHRGSATFSLMEMRQTIPNGSTPVFSSRLLAARLVPAALPYREKEYGFTLVELLVVLAILGLLIGLVGPAMMRQLGSAKHRIADQSVERLAGILDLYRLDVGSYPTTQQGLAALNLGPAGVAGWNGPYTKDPSGILDPWGRPFAYRAPSQRGGHPFDIMSLGADGMTGGTGEDADIQSD
jgi:general secretion pathway protein G